MNKISKICIILVLVMMAFTVGYKVGDSRGYNDGYKEGYRYDCKDEIANLYDQVKTLSKSVNFAQQSITKTQLENDRLRYQQRSDSIYKATGKQLPPYDSAVKKNLAVQRKQIEAMRQMFREGKLK